MKGRYQDVVAFRVTASDRRLLERLAELEDRSISSLLRHLLREAARARSLEVSNESGRENRKEG